MSDEVDTTVLGSLDEAELNEVKALQQFVTGLLCKVGELEDQKLNVLFRIQESRERSETVLRSAVSRIGIPDGVAYQLGRDGVFRRTVTGG